MYIQYGFHFQNIKYQEYKITDVKSFTKESDYENN